MLRAGDAAVSGVRVRKRAVHCTAAFCLLCGFGSQDQCGCGMPVRSSRSNTSGSGHSLLFRTLCHMPGAGLPAAGAPPCAHALG